MLNRAIDITAALLFAYVILMWIREPLKPGKAGNSAMVKLIWLDELHQAD